MDKRYFLLLCDLHFNWYNYLFKKNKIKKILERTNIFYQHFFQFGFQYTIYKNEQCYAKNLFQENFDSIMVKLNWNKQFSAL